MDIKEESLKKALTATRITELPKQDKGGADRYWLEAIVLVRKRDSSLSYATAKRGNDGKIFYTSDFGNMSPIVGLVSIHPYVYLDSMKYEYHGDISTKREALIRYIGGDTEAKESVEKMSDEEVENAMLNIAIEAQYVDKAVKNTHERIISAVKGDGVKMDEDDNPTKKPRTRRDSKKSCKK